MGSILRVVNNLLLTVWFPLLLATACFVNADLFTACYLLVFFGLMIFHPHRFLPENWSKALYLCVFAAVISVISLLGLFVVSILVWVNGGDVYSSGILDELNPLLGWGALGEVSSLNGLRLTIPPTAVLVTSLYLSFMLFKKKIFIEPPAPETPENKNDPSEKRKRRVLRKAKLRFLRDLLPAPYHNAVFLYFLLLVLFVCGAAYASVLSGGYFLLCLVGVVFVGGGGVRKFFYHFWRVVFFYSVGHVSMIYVYQFKSITEAMGGEEGCVEASGVTGLFGLYRYTCLNHNVQDNWYYVLGYVATWLLLFLLAKIYHTYVIIAKLEEEGYPSPSFIRNRNTNATHNTQSHSVSPTSSPSSSPSPFPSSSSFSSSSSSSSSSLRFRGSQPPSPALSSSCPPASSSSPLVSSSSALSASFASSSEHNFKLVTNFKAINPTGNPIYDKQMSAIRAKILVGRHGYIPPYLGLLLLSIFLPSLLLYPLLLVVLVAPLLPASVLFSCHRGVLGYLLLFILAQYVYNIPLVGQIDLPLCEDLGTDVCFDCGLICLLQNLGLRLYRYGGTDNCDEPYELYPVNLTFPLVGMQCVIAFLMAFYIRFCISPTVSKEELDGLISLNEEKAPEEIAPDDEDDEELVKDKIKQKLSLAWRKFWHSKVLRAIRRELFCLGILCLSRAYAFSLIALYICGLSEISLLNSIYILFFLFFVLFPKTREPVWPFFVIYSGFVLSILVVWQVTWSVPYDCSLVGLRHFSSFIHPSEENPCYECSDSATECIWDLWRGAFWHVVIFITGVIQLAIDRTLFSLKQQKEQKKEEREERKRRKSYISIEDNEDNLVLVEGELVKEEKKEREKERKEEGSPFHQLEEKMGVGMKEEKEGEKEEEEKAESFYDFDEDSLVDQTVGYLEGNYSNFGLGLVYLTLLLVATLTNDQSPPKDNSECTTSGQTSVINVVYIVVFFICLNIHLILKSEGAGRAANWVVIVVLPLFVGIFLASYLCQWTPFYDHVMVPFQEAHNNDDVFAWLGLYRYTKPDNNSFFPDPRCCRDESSTGVCGYPVTNYFIDWDMIISLAPRAAVVLVAAWQVNAYADQSASSSPSPSPSAPSKNRIFSAFITLYDFACRVWMLHMHKLAIISMFLVVVSGRFTAINLVLLIVAIISTPLQNGPNAFGFLVMFFLEVVVLTQFGLRFVCYSTINKKDAIQWFGFATHPLLWGDINGYIGVILCIILLRLAVRASEEHKTKRGPAPYGECCSLFPTKTYGLFHLEHDMDYENFYLLDNEERESLNPERKTVRIDVGQVAEVAGSSEPPAVLHGDGKKFDVSQKIISYRAMLDSCGWYLSNIFRIHGFGIALLVLLFVVFARVNLFSLFYFAFFLYGNKAGKWPFLRKCSWMLFFVSICVILQYCLLLEIPHNISWLGGEVFCEEKKPLEDASGLSFLIGSIKCWLYRAPIKRTHFVSFCFKPNELLWDMFLCFFFGLLVRQNHNFPHVGTEEEWGNGKALSIQESSPALSSKPSDESTPLMSDNEEKLYTNGGFKKQKKQKKQGEEEEDGLYGCEELKVKLYKNPFALTNEQLFIQDNFTFLSLFLSSQDDFTAPPQTPLDVFKTYLLLLSKTLTTVIVLIAGTIQADLISLGYVTISVAFWYLDQWVSQKGNKAWRYLVYYNLVVLSLLLLYQPLLLFLALVEGEAVVKDGGDQSTRLGLIMSNAIGLSDFVPCSPPVDPTQPVTCGVDAPCFDAQNLNGVEQVEWTVSSYSISSFDNGGLVFIILIWAMLQIQTDVYDSIDWKKVWVRSINNKASARQTASEKEEAKNLIRQEYFDKIEERQKHRRQVLIQLREARAEKVRFLQGLEFPDSPIIEEENALEDLLEKKEKEEEKGEEKKRKEEKKKRLYLDVEARNPFLKPRKPEGVEEAEEEEESLKEKALKLLELAKKMLFLMVSQVYKLGCKRDIEEDYNLLCFFIGVWGCIASNSHAFVYMMMCINQMGNYDLISLYYPLSAFGYAAIQWRKPHTRYWRVTMLYCAATILLKFLCSILGNSFLSKETNSPMLHCEGGSDIQWLVLPVGLSTLNAAGTGFLEGVFWDILLFMVLLWHRHNLKRTGMWWVTVDSTDQSMDRLLRNRDSTMDHISRASVSVRSHLAFPPPPSPSAYEEIEEKKEEEGEGEREREEEGDGNGKEKGDEKEGEEEERGLFFPTVQADGTEEMVDQEMLQEMSRLDEGDEEEEEEEELEVAEKEPGLVDGLKKAKDKVLHFVEGVLARRSPYEDYYSKELFIEVLCFLFLVLFSQDFTGVQASELGSLLETNRIPRNYLLLVFFQFCLIIWGRVIYLKRSTLLKLATQYFLLIFFHVVLIFSLPAQKGSYEHCPPGFYTLNGVQIPLRTVAVVIFYFLKCFYFWFSALQLRVGFPVVVEERTLYKSVSIPAYVAFQIYYGIPFLYEMRSVLDWAAFPTTLDLYQYLKLEDVYVQLYIATYFASRRDSEKRYLGDPQPQFIKILMGFGLFLLLVILIWFPLFLMSSANPANMPNPVVASTLRFTIEGFEPLYINTVTNNSISSVSQNDFLEYKCMFQLSSDDQINSQLVNYLNYSETPWLITNPSRDALISKAHSCCRNNVKNPLALSLNIQFTHRSGSTNQRTYATPLVQDSCCDLWSLLTSPTEGSSFFANNFTDRGVRLPTSGPPVTLHTQNSFSEYAKESFQFAYYTDVSEIPDPSNSKKNVTVYQEFWGVEQLGNGVPVCYHSRGSCACSEQEASNCTQPNNCRILFDSEGPQIFAVSSEILTGIAQTLASAGIIGLYVGVVFAIAQFLRIAVSKLYLQIPYEDMPDPSEIMNQCEFIFAARQMGDLDLEEELYWELIELYRSPEEIKRRSNRKDKQE